MDLREYNRLRDSLEAPALAAGFSVLALGLLGAAKLVILCAICLCIFIVLGIKIIGIHKKLDQFVCPACGKVPHIWCSEDPSEDSARTDTNTEFCVHCKLDLRSGDL